METGLMTGGCGVVERRVHCVLSIRTYYLGTVLYTYYYKGMFAAIYLTKEV